MGMVDGQLVASASARELLTQFLSEGKATLDESVIDYLSEVVWEEALQPSNGRSSRQIADALRLFAPSLSCNDLEARLEHLLEKLRLSASTRNGNLCLEGGHAANADKLQPNEPSANQEDWSSSSPLASRSPPAAAFLASTSTMRDILGSNGSLSSSDFCGSPRHSAGLTMRAGSPAASHSTAQGSESGDLRSAGSSGNLSNVLSRLHSSDSTSSHCGKAEEVSGNPATDRYLTNRGGTHSANGSNGAFSPGSQNFTDSAEMGTVSIPSVAALAASGSGSSHGGSSGVGSPRTISLNGSLGPIRTGSPSAGNGTQNGLGSLRADSILGTSAGPPPSSFGPSSDSPPSPQGASLQLPVRRSLSTVLSFGRISLNPNAAEFVPTSKPAGPPMSPSSLGSPGSKSGGFSSRSAPNLSEAMNASSGIQKSISMNSNTSDDEYRRYWREQLPDELISFDDIPAELLEVEDSFDYEEPPIMPPRGSPGLGQGLGPGLGMGLGHAHRSGMSFGPGPAPGPGPRGGPAGMGPSLGSGTRGPPLGAASRGPMHSPPPGSMGPGWGMNSSPGGGPPPSGPSGSPMGPPPGSPLQGPPPGGLAPGMGGNGYGYGPRGPHVSPHRSPPRGAHYSPPGGRYSHGLPSHMREGPSTPPGHGYGRPFGQPEHRSGIPPSFQLPPGQAGLRERPPPPPWQAEVYDMEGPLADMHPDSPFRDDRLLDDPIGVLAAEFPTFAADSLADIYVANGGDLGLTIEMLTQLELQEDGGRSPRRRPPPPPPSLTAMDFPALSNAEMGNGILPHHLSGLDSPPLGVRLMDDHDRPYPGRAGPPGENRSGPDFAAVVRKQAQQAHWQQQQYERNGGLEMGPPRGRSPVPGHGLEPGPYPGEGRGGPGERMEHYGPPRDMPRGPPQPWLETGEAVASMYADMREEARSHARVRNVYFEQATQAYLAGNKALAKELSAKGQWHNEQMKAAHAKAGEAIFRQRNVASGFLGRGGPGGGPGGQARVLDLHGLHVNEAIPMLKRELAGLRAVARNTGQRQQLYVCVGTGHHTKGRTPRLPLAVERHLVEEERAQVTETQPGMLRVVV